jgi:peptidyl-prolyl cis-trans isomerase SurA
MIRTTISAMIFRTTVVTGLLVGAISLTLQAQIQDPKTLFTVGGKPVSIEEFRTVYMKNNQSKDAFSEKDLKEYLELYTKFKVKVAEAFELKLDTSSTFKNELSSYRTQLAQPYLRDKQTIDQLVKEAWERNKTEIRASHILIRITENASPADTLTAFRRISEIRSRLVKGEEFGAVALESSEDPSVKQNKGDLGWFGAFRMIYPFENMAYTTPKGQFSEVFRTQFGYHILIKKDERPSLGEVRAAHIMVLSRPNDPDSLQAVAKTRVEEIEKKLKAGENFESLARQFSEDPSSNRNGGAMPWFGTGRMVPEFEEAAFALKNVNDVSVPVKTAYGWHIIKLLEKRGIPPFEEAKADLQSKVERDARLYTNRTNLLAKLKKEYNVTHFNAALEATLNLLDSNIVAGNFKMDSAKIAGLNQKLFDFAPIPVPVPTTTIKTTATTGKKTTVPARKGAIAPAVRNTEARTASDFINFVIKNQAPAEGADPKMLGRKLYDSFVDDQIMAYEDSRLDQKYPEFKNLMTEYREGILLFDLTDKMVWTKAVQDSTGLKAFYEKVKQNHLWGERVEGGIFYCANEKIASNVRKDVKRGKLTGVEMLKKFASDNPLNLRIEEGKFEKSAKDVLSKIVWQPGISENQKIENQIVFVNIKKILAPEPKMLSEIRGVVTSEYQNVLEKSWIEGLMKKFPVVVNEAAFQALIKR